MLKKLLKYELEGIFKFLIIFYALALIFGIMTRIFFYIDNSFIMNLIAQICSGATISIMVSILINNLMRLWVGFKQNLYGDESYLTHTLPVEKKILYLSKIVTSIITLFSSILVIGLTLFIAYYSKENIETLKNILLPVANAYGSTILKILLAFMFIFFLEFVNLLQAGYTGVILGHKMNNNKTAFSVIFGFVYYLVVQFFVLIVIFLTSLFNKDIMDLFFTNKITNIDTVKVIIYLAIIIYIVTFVIGYFINIKLFKKGVNVD